MLYAFEFSMARKFMIYALFTKDEQVWDTKVKLFIGIWEI